MMNVYEVVRMSDKLTEFGLTREQIHAVIRYIAEGKAHPETSGDDETGFEMTAEELVRAMNWFEAKGKTGEDFYSFMKYLSEGETS